MKKVLLLIFGIFVLAVALKNVVQLTGQNHTPAKLVMTPVATVSEYPTWTPQRVATEESNYKRHQMSDCNFEYLGRCYANSEEVFRATLMHGDEKDDLFLRTMALEFKERTWTPRYQDEVDFLTTYLKENHL
jgi:hypothetical protein